MSNGKEGEAGVMLCRSCEGIIPSGRAKLIRTDGSDQLCVPCKTNQEQEEAQNRARLGLKRAGFPRSRAIKLSNVDRSK